MICSKAMSIVVNPAPPSVPTPFAYYKLDDDFSDVIGARDLSVYPSGSPVFVGGLFGDG